MGLGLIPEQGKGLQVRPDRKAQKAAVRLAPADQILHLGELPAAEQLEPDTGIQAHKFLHDGGQQLNGGAGKGAHPQSAPGQPMKGGHLGLQFPPGVAEGLQIGKQGFPLGGEHHPTPVSGEQRHVPLPLQIRYGAAYRNA